MNSVRSLLMRLIFSQKYPTLDNHMSESNVGGRKKLCGINHIWVVNRRSTNLSILETCDNTII